MATRLVEVYAVLATNSTPLGNKTLSLKHRVTGQTEWTDDGTQVTDATNGDASWELNLDVPQSYDFWVQFAGDNDYEASEKILTNYRIKATTNITVQINYP